METKEKFWTVRETAELLNTSVKVVQRLVREGLLPAVRFNRRLVRIRESELEQFISKAGSSK